MFKGLAQKVHRHRGLVVFSCFLVLGFSVASFFVGGRLSTGGILGTEASHAQALAEGPTAAAHDLTLAVLFHSAQQTQDSPAFRSAVGSALQRAAALPGVSSVVSPFEGPEAHGGHFISKTGHDVLGLVRLKGDEPTAVANYPEIRRALDAPGLDVQVTGKVAFLGTLTRVLKKDLLIAELLSFPLALLVLLRVFRTFVAAALPAVVGGLAVMSGVAGVVLLSHVTEMAQYALNVVSLIGMGVAIDYSLFIVSRFRTELQGGLSVEAALVRTMDTAGRAVAFSGLAVAVGLSGLLFYRGSYLSAMGLGGAIVVAFAVLYALTLLPAVLSFLGPRIDRGRVPFPRFFESAGMWRTLATWVMRHPWRVLIPTLSLLLAIGIPFRRLELAATDLKALPKSSEPRRAADKLAEAFPREASTRILVVVEFPNGQAFAPDRIKPLYDLSRRFAQLPGVTGVESVVDLDPSLSLRNYLTLAKMPEEALPPEFDLAKVAFLKGNLTVMNVLTQNAPTSRAARDLVRQIRANRSVGDGRLWVGGQSAADIDANHFVAKHTPAAVGFVMGVTCLVLFVMLGSLLLPIKATVMNLFSISGAFGALVWIFQEGHLRSFLKFEPAPVEPSLPILLFCVLFGLSMDYEVLMLSRMREEWLRSKDNTHAVAEGLEHTGGLITNAAAIMISVFAAFSLATVVVVKAMGVGMALAVAIDATLVRILLVPAMMRLLGNLNWWTPRPLVPFFSALNPRHEI